MVALEFGGLRRAADRREPAGGAADRRRGGTGRAPQQPDAAGDLRGDRDLAGRPRAGGSRREPRGVGLRPVPERGRWQQHRVLARAERVRHVRAAASQEGRGGGARADEAPGRERGAGRWPPRSRRRTSRCRPGSSSSTRLDPDPRPHRDRRRVRREAARGRDDRRPRAGRTAPSSIASRRSRWRSRKPRCGPIASGSTACWACGDPETDWSTRAARSPRSPRPRSRSPAWSASRSTNRQDLRAARWGVDLVGRALALRRKTRFFPVGLHVGINTREGRHGRARDRAGAGAAAPDLRHREGVDRAARGGAPARPAPARGPRRERPLGGARGEGPDARRA